jgi:hypothetical protein
VTGFFVLLLIALFLVVRSITRQQQGGTARERVSARRAEMLQRVRRQFDAARTAETIGTVPPDGQDSGGDPPLWTATSWSGSMPTGPPAYTSPPVAPVAMPTPPTAEPTMPRSEPALPELDEPVESVPTASALSSGMAERYVGSAALESTLDSTIESSLLGVPAGPVTMAALPGGTALDLPRELEAQVVALLADGHEVAAVRLLCDELECTLLEAMRTVQTLS